MSLWNIVVLILALYLLAGTVAAYLNFRIVGSRVKIVEGMNEFRLEAFQKGLPIQIEFDKSVKEIGIDEEFALRSDAVKDLSKMGLSIGAMHAIVAIAITIIGPYYYCLPWKDYRKLRKLQIAYQHFLSLRSKILSIEQ